MRALTQAFTPRWLARHRTAVALVILTLALIAFGTWRKGSDEQAATALQTALERDETAYFSGVGDDLQARERYMVAKGVHVTSADADANGVVYCPTAFPVVGTPYGVYYAPNDDTYPKVSPDTDRIGVCFTTADAAAAAGYVHGSVNLTVTPAE